MERKNVSFRSSLGVIVALIAGLCAGCATASKSLVADLASEDAAVKAQAQSKLQKKGPAALPVIEDSLSDEKMSVAARKEALLIVGEIGKAKPASVPDCVRVLAKAAEQPALQTHAVAGLVDLGKPAVPYITQQMLQTDNRSAVQGMAAAIKLLNGIGSIDTLIGVLKTTLPKIESKQAEVEDETRLVRACNALGYLAAQDLPPVKTDATSELRLDIVKTWIKWWADNKNTFSFS